MSFVFGSFFGVLGGFATERVYNWYRNKMDSSKLKENLKSELDRCIKKLIGKGNLLPTMMWKSTVATGDLSLLPFNQRTKLAMIYFAIENHNYEAKRVRDGAVIAQTGGIPRTLLNGRPQAEAYWIRLSKNLVSEEEGLKHKITEFLKEPWL